MNEERREQVRAASKMTLVGVGLNGILAVVKFSAGHFGNSQALVADAIESLGDVFSSLVVLVGMRISSRPPDANHPYGHGKFEPMAAVVVALLLFAAALGIVIQSIQHIISPHPAPELFTLPVLLLVIATKWVLFRRVGRLSDQLSSAALEGDALHHKSDALTSVAAVVGITVALIGGDRYASADDYAALIATLLIAHGAYRILTPALHELSDRAPENDLVDRIKSIARTVPGVVELEKCFVRKMGFVFYVDLHVVVNGALSVREGHSISHRVEEAIQRAIPEIAEVLVHIEPTR